MMRKRFMGCSVRSREKIRCNAERARGGPDSLEAVEAGSGTRRPPLVLMGRTFSCRAQVSSSTRSVKRLRVLDEVRIGTGSDFIEMKGEAKQRLGCC